MSTNGQPHEAHDLQEVATVPAKGQIVIRMQFTNYTGKTVLDCYILNHEVGHDGGPYRLSSDQLHRGYYELRRCCV